MDIPQVIPNAHPDCLPQTPVINLGMEGNRPDKRVCPGLHKLSPSPEAGPTATLSPPDY